MRIGNLNNQDLVLLGGGHTHVLLIKALAMKPISGVRVSLISERSLTPYSGMLPGYVAGHYALNQTNIDLNRLCRKAGVRWIQARCDGIDTSKKRLHLLDQPPVDYDALSIDIGSTPNLSIAGAAEFAIGVKPIAQFQTKWRALLKSLDHEPLDPSSDALLHWGVIGAGAGGVELVLAMAHRLRAHAHIRFHLVYRGEQILPGYPQRVVRYAEQALSEYGVELHPEFSVAAVQQDGLCSDSSEFIRLDTSIWCTGAVGAAWLADSGLALTRQNFVEVNSHLQSRSHSSVFAVGDIANNQDDPRPKAGVFAVRQAPFLERNVRRFFAQEPLLPANLQSQFLSLLALGDKIAVGSRNGLTVKGRWVWRWKDHIDMQFMQQFAELEMMPMLAQTEPEMPLGQPPCGGCGSKLGPRVLHDNLTRLNGANGVEVEDAAVWQPTVGQLSVQTVDGFRRFISDESRFAQICLVHALSDLYAMGATPKHIQLWINLAFAGASLQQRDHLRMLQGVQTVLDAQNISLSGGHSSQGAETHLGVVAVGEVSPSGQWRKGGASIGDVIVMSKALGSGVLLAADMQGAANAQDMDGLLQSMLHTNISAMQQLQDCAPTAVTDITGFGLIGHLLEMLDAASAHKAQAIGADLRIDSVPLLPGALALATSGWRASLFAELEPYLKRCYGALEQDPDAELAARLSLMVDPQTSGGLLATLAPAAAEKLLRNSSNFCVIGNVIDGAKQPAQQRIKLV